MLDLPLADEPRYWPRERDDLSRSDLEEDEESLSRRDEEDFLSLLKEDW